MFLPALYSLSARDLSGPLIQPVWFHQLLNTGSQVPLSIAYTVPKDQLMVLYAATFTADGGAASLWQTVRLEIQNPIIHSTQGVAGFAMYSGRGPGAPDALNADAIFTAYFHDLLVPPGTVIRIFGVRSGGDTVNVRFSWMGYLMPLANIRW